jgi:hypothetical protein
MRLVGHVARVKASRNAYMVMVGKLEGNIPVGKPRHRWSIIGLLKWILEK